MIPPSLPLSFWFVCRMWLCKSCGHVILFCVLRSHNPRQWVDINFHSHHLIKTLFTPFSISVSLLYPLKTWEKLRVSHIFRGHRSGTLVEYGIIVRTSRKAFLKHLGEWIFQIFSRLHTTMVDAPSQFLFYGSVYM